MLHYIKLMRVQQWIKNLLVFAPLLFSVNLLNIVMLKQAILAFLAFSLLASTVYIINDIIDLEKDKLHPRKMYRPLPSGTISITNACILLVMCLIGSFTIALQLPAYFSGILILYILLNISYSVFLKNISLIDCFCIALGFILRVLAGCYAIGVVASDFILIVTFFLALFLVFIKRKSELIILTTSSTAHRKSLDGYSESLLNTYIFICTTITLIGYLFYSIDENTIRVFGNDYLKYSLLFVTYGMFRFIQLGEGKEYNGEGDPTTLILNDRAIQLSILLWIIYVAVVIYA